MLKSMWPSVADALKTARLFPWASMQRIPMHFALVPATCSVVEGILVIAVGLLYTTGHAFERMWETYKLYLLNKTGLQGKALDLSASEGGSLLPSRIPLKGGQTVQVMVVLVFWCAILNRAYIEDVTLITHDFSMLIIRLRSLWGLIKCVSWESNLDWLLERQPC